MKIFKILVAVFLVMSSVSCEGERMSTQKNIDVNDYKIDPSALKSLADKKVYFAHQSVGGNILDGIEEILKSEESNEIKILKRAESDLIDGPALIHEYIGENGDPLLKIKEFKDSLMNGLGKDADIALMKFCYLDINKTTDVGEVFNEYKKAMSEIKSRYPDLEIMHITVPLTMKDSPLRGFIKNLIGRPDNNIMRARYNVMLKQEYQGKQPILDLAAIESTREDGSRTEQKTGSLVFYSLAPEYAADNGHLNRLGQLKAGKIFAEFLVGYSGN